MSKFVVLVVLIGLFSVPMMAADYSKVEVFGGYQYLHTGTIHVSGVGDIPNSSQSFNGWDASLTANLKKSFGVTGDFSGSYATIGGVSTHLYTYAGGPVVSLNSEGKVNPFVHGLFGGVRLTGSELGVSASENGFTAMFGGGVDVRAKGAIALRLVQADWVYYHFGSTNIGGVAVPSFSQSNNVRVSTGIVLRF